ncbi:hypothetical protein DKX38_011836 [Salix brachista]|uniref:Uncharacterized protein n=1 Tax=Salix brachista TaxID=2182728 RepID=A0A5N5M033_9ROSI|nr:hypothetical protein DKX38_011836 [Salix brachista]
MGVMSRRVVPACGSLCFFCPSLRARSRQPVKRYKKLIADILPPSILQETEPNDRKIGKLCEYASKNPLRIPKITDTLEQRFYKELRHENFGSVKVVVCIYRKLLSSCKEQMPLFASSLLSIVRTLLEQTGKDDLRLLACNVLVDFISCQMDGTYMFNLEGLIPKLCQLAQEAGNNERTLRLRSAGLQVLGSMVCFMGEQAHISMDFDSVSRPSHIISVTLENYIDFQMNPDTMEDQWVQGVLKTEDNGSSFPDISKKVSLSDLTTKPELDLAMDTSKSPSYWSRVCLCNMARLAKEATTIRRVLEPLFQNFDANNHWSLEKGVAYPVLTFLQSLLVESGENSHLLLSILVKHLDHKSVAKQTRLLVDIVNVTARLGQSAKQQSTVAIIGAISDLMKHLRKCLQNSFESSSPRDGINERNADLQVALENCIAQLSNKVGDVGPILDTIAVFLENIPATTVVARTTISAVHQTARIISSIPNISYHKKAFPDALFHQLLVAMAHPDHETRVGAHSVFSILLMPSLLSPGSDSEAVSGFFGSSASQKRSKSFSFQDESEDNVDAMDEKSWEEGNLISDVSANHDSHDRPNNFKRAVLDGKTLTSLRLSSHQVSLLLSSIWVQATSAENLPANFEAMGHTYNIALLFTRSKTSSHVALVRCFQLAFSLRSISLDQEGLQPSRRRSLFTLSSFMLIFAARAGNLPELIPFVKVSLTEKTADPYLELVEDIKLQAIYVESEEGKIAYGSEEDDVAALKSLSHVEVDDSHLKETLISRFMTKFVKLSEDELSGIKQQLLQDFSPDDVYPLGAPLFMDTPRPCSPLARMEFQAFEEIMPAAALTDDESFTELNGSQSGRKTSISVHTLDILSVNELLESVLETARQVASSQVSSTPVPYDQMKSQCEALVTGKQQKMSILHSFKHQPEAKVFPGTDEKKDTSVHDVKMELPQCDLKLAMKDQIRAPDQLALCSLEYGQNSFRLPPSSPYDKFLKAAGC